MTGQVRGTDRACQRWNLTSMKGQLKTESSFSLYRTFELEVGTTSTQKLGIWTGITVELEAEDSLSPKTNE